MTNSDYISLDECKDGWLYVIDARNSRLGIYREAQKGFTIRREKFGAVFLFTEFHWDTGAPHGTASPLKELFRVSDEFLNADEDKLLGYLASQYDELKDEIETVHKADIESRLKRREGELSPGHLSVDECKDGWLYVVQSRSGIVGIYEQEKKQFKLRRSEFGGVHIQHEFHLDAHEKYGTVKPLKALWKVADDTLEENDDLILWYLADVANMVRTYTGMETVRDMGPEHLEQLDKMPPYPSKFRRIQ